MTTARKKRLIEAVEDYLSGLRRIRASGGATGERSSYGPLAELLNAVGATLKPKVFCVGELADQGAGHPDFGLYSARQVQRGRPREGQVPERGVVEVKSIREDTHAAQVREQTSRYWGRYRLVLVTNLREFTLIGPDATGREESLEAFCVADHRCGVRSTAGAAARLRPRDRPGLERVSVPGAVPSGRARRAEGSWLGSSLPMPAMGSRGSRRQAILRRSRRCVRRSKTPSACGSKASEEHVSFIRPWYRRCSMVSFPLGCCGHAKDSSLEESVQLARSSLAPTRTGASSCCFSSCLILDVYGRSVSSRYWTGLRPRSTGWTSPRFSHVFNEGEAVAYFYEPFLEAFDP